LSLGAFVAALRRVSLQRISVRLLEAVTAPHGPDRYLEMISPMWSLREVRAEIIEVRRPALGSVTLLLRPNRNWRGFRAGQHVALTIEIDGVRRTRCYSLACSAQSGSAQSGSAQSGSAQRKDGLLELTVAAEPDGVVSGYLNSHVCPGAVVRLSQAQGGFLLPDHRPEHVLLISGGSGITPVMSMLRTLCEEGFCAVGGPGEITFLHYARSADHVAYRDELAALAVAYPGLRLVRAYTRGGGGELSGRFTPRHLPAVNDRTAAWVCGPAGLVEAVRAHWLRCGIGAALQTEQFSAPAPAVPAEDGQPYGEVCFARSGRRVTNTGASVLDQAESAGLRPEFGCRMGICLTCTRRKTAGSVRHVYTGELSTEADSQIQICSTVPVGDITVDL
jgi:stearoyl-CoA 9-desaturase NADPH oxidoreductase